MKILHVHERAGFYGGVEQILYDTARGLAAREGSVRRTAGCPTTPGGRLSGRSFR